MPMTRSPIVAAALVAVAACHTSTAAAPRPPLWGRWQKLETSLPPVTLEVRTNLMGQYEGQVWLSGVTYTLPATLDDTSVVLIDAADSHRPPLVGVLQKDGRLRVTIGGTPPVEALLVRLRMED